MSDFTPDELEQLITYHLEHELDRGTVIRNLGAWRASTRQQCLENEKLLPVYITRSVLAITARKDGKRLTYCSETRGTHAISYIYDPRGTTEPPSWWNRDEAKREHDEWAKHQKHGKPRPPAEVEALARKLRNIGIKESA